MRNYQTVGLCTTRIQFDAGTSYYYGAPFRETVLIEVEVVYGPSDFFFFYFWNSNIY